MKYSPQQRRSFAKWRGDQMREVPHAWPGGFRSGDQVTISGTAHHEEPGEVVKWKDNWGTPHRGLVPVFLPKYNATSFWWFHPGNLLPRQSAALCQDAATGDQT